MTVGERIRIMRENAQMTQEQLGRLCGTTKQTIFKYESNVITNIPLDRVEKIADVLNVPPARLTGWEDKYFDSCVHESKRSTHLDLYGTEQNLVLAYRSLNAEGQEKLLDYAEDLSASGRYIKTDPPDLVQKQA